MSVPSLGKNDFWGTKLPKILQGGVGSDKSNRVGKEGVHIRATLPHIRENASALASGLPRGDKGHR